MIIVVITILVVGSSYSSVSLIPLQSAIDHYKAFAKKQDDGSNNSGGFTSSSDKTRSSTWFF